MPELPEVETVKETLKHQILNKKIKNIIINYSNIIKEDLETFKFRLIGKSIIDIKRKGKFLIFVLDDINLICHLRMEGKFFLKETNLDYEKHEHIIFQFDDNTDLRYHDTRKFGIMVTKYDSELYNTLPLSNLGYEPFDDNLTKEYLYTKYQGLKKTIKEVLLDQSIMTGLGNIYADEVCFLCNLNPSQKANELTITDCDNIIVNSRNVLNKAILRGGTTIRSYTSSLGVTGLFQLELLVHTKVNEPCPNCNDIILKTRVGGRGTY